MSALHLLLDLDGTLTDPREGILRCYAHAFARLGLPVPEEAALLACIGPPLQACFAELLGPAHAHRVDEAVARYRERYATHGMFENAVYPGIPACLAALAARVPLHVVTSKAAPFARAIVEHFGLAPYFRTVLGAEPDGSLAAKADLVRALLDREGIAPQAAVMIGDREHDVRGALAHGVAACGVAWGYGSEAELRAAGAHIVFHAPAELPPYFQGAGAGPATPPPRV